MNKRKEYHKEYYLYNKNKIKEQQEKNKDNNKEVKKDYYNKNKERIKLYNIQNKVKIASYIRNKRQTDIQTRLQGNLRDRLREALKNETKIGSAISDLGCSIQHLKLHLELFWDKGMTWDNYGNKEGHWSIDHIKPLSKFDLTNREQLLEAVNFRNLQPLWHVDNLRKGIRCN